MKRICSALDTDVRPARSASSAAGKKREPGAAARRPPRRAPRRAEPKPGQGAEPLRVVRVRPAGGHRRLLEGDRDQGQLRDLRLERGDAVEAPRGGTRYDLIQPSEYTVEALIKQKKLKSLDQSRIPNLKNIAPERSGTSRTTRSSSTRVPWMAGTVGIVVNTEKVKEPVKGFKDVFQAEAQGAHRRR